MNKELIKLCKEVESCCGRESDLNDRDLEIIVNDFDNKYTIIEKDRINKLIKSIEKEQTNYTPPHPKWNDIHYTLEGIKLMIGLSLDK